MVNYFNSVFESNKKPKGLFNFTENQIDITVIGLTKSFFSADALKAFPMLNSLYYFAEYLFVCGNFDKKQRDEMQDITIKFHRVVYNNTKEFEIETKVFEKFPLY